MTRNLIDELEIEKGHSDSMADAARYWQRRAEVATMTLAIVVKAAGGEVTVHHDLLAEANLLDLERWYEPKDMSHHFRATIKKPGR